jgi:hypothetical protein
MDRNLYLVFAIIISLSGCGEKITSLCGTSGGKCCKLDGGSPETSTYSCEQTKKACLDSGQAYGIQAIWDYSPDIGTERGRCEMEVKSGIRLGSQSIPINRLPMGSLSQIANSSASQPIKTKEGDLISPQSPEYCKEACGTGHAAFCPNIAVPNSIGIGVLTLSIDLAEQSDATAKIIPFQKVIDRFGLPADSNLCNRGPVLASNKAFTNKGPSECTSDISMPLGNDNVQGDVTLPANLEGVPLAKEKLAHFGSGTALTLKLKDQGLAEYSGPILVAGRYRATHIGAQIQGPNKVVCAELYPTVENERPLEQIAKFAAANPNSLDVAYKSLTEYWNVTESTKYGGLELDNSSTKPELFPNTSNLDRLKKIATKNGLAAFGDKVHGSIEGLAITTTDLIYLIDVGICADLSKDIPIERMVSMLPHSGISEEQDKEKELLAGKILQCKIGVDYVGKKQREDIRKYYKSI